MPNPLDVAHGFGEFDELIDLFEQLQNHDDPLTILLYCELVDEDERWPTGTAFTLYIHYLKITH